MHLWAHVAHTGPGCAHDPRYVAWTAAHLNADAEAIAADASVIGPRFDAALHLYSELFADWAAFERASVVSLSEVAPAAGTDTAVLDALRGSAVAQLVHASVASWGRDFVTAWDAVARPELQRGRAAVDVALAMATAVMPTLRLETIDLSFALGSHGRAFPTRIVVGAPTCWNEQPAMRTAVVALHEHAVRTVSEADYVTAEWSALAHVAAMMVRRGPTAFREAHRRWLSALDLGPLSAAAVQRGWIAAADATALLEWPAERPERLQRAKSPAR